MTLSDTNTAQANAQELESQATQTLQQPYQFPIERLGDLQHNDKTPLVLVLCGSFSPVTLMHLRMCEMAFEWVGLYEKSYEVVGIYLSPVSDHYKKQDLAAANHRVAMCRLGLEDTYSPLMVDHWEAIQDHYVPTAQVLDHFRNEINEGRGGIKAPDGTRRPAHVSLLAGADLLMTMTQPGVWSEQDLDLIFSDGMYVVERSGTDMQQAKTALSQYTDKINVIPLESQSYLSSLSSTKVRSTLRKARSVKDWIPDGVIQYVHAQGLYQPTE